MNEAAEEFRKDAEFFTKQPRNTLMIIKQTMRIESIYEHDANRKMELKEMAELAY